MYSSVNIGDSRAMKRLSYVTMIFLPASFVAVGCFSVYHLYQSSDKEGFILRAFLG